MEYNLTLFIVLFVCHHMQWHAAMEEIQLPSYHEVHQPQPHSLLHPCLICLLAACLNKTKYIYIRMLIAVVCIPLDTWIITVCFFLSCGIVLDSIKNLEYGQTGVMVQSFPVDTDQIFFVSSLLCHIMGVPFWQ